VFDGGHVKLPGDGHETARWRPSTRRTRRAESNAANRRLLHPASTDAQALLDYPCGSTLAARASRDPRLAQTGRCRDLLIGGATLAQLTDRTQPHRTDLINLRP
jgi:hypothetical protein